MEFTTISQAKKQTGLSYLGSINSSAKIIKNKKVSNNYTYILYLAPADTSGYEVCKHSCPECRLGCLATSGRVILEKNKEVKTIQSARIKKTKLFFEHREFFMKWLIAEMQSAQRKANRDGYYFSARLNGTSEITWENILTDGKTLFEIFPDVKFYDYTKNAKRYSDINFPKNYHLTFSYTGRNTKNCLDLLAKGNNVAIIYNIKDVKDFPKTWNGYKVINGDLTDYRPNDGKGVVVGLKWKKIANKEVNEQIKNSKFVLQVNVPELVK